METRSGTYVPYASGSRYLVECVRKTLDLLSCMILLI